MNNEELVELYQQGDKQALDKLIEGNGGIVRKLAIKYNNINELLELDDLIQAGYVGLINAANRYDNTMENKANFITYAFYYIEREIQVCVNGRTSKDINNTKFYKTVKSLNVPVGEEEETVIAKSIPYSELAKNKFVDETRKLSEKIVNLRSFFGVTNLISIPKVNAAYRKANICKENEYALITWIRIAEIQSKNIETQRFNRKNLIKALPRIRQLTQFEPEVFYKELVDLLADCGIALVIANHLSGTGVHGVTFLNNKKNKLIVQLSVRRKYADTFWFTLFHEISHIVTDESEEFSYLACDEETESRMDKVARDILIPEERYRDFINRYNYNNYSAIQRFAKEIEIHPCIVIGRLQYDQYLSYSTFSNLRPKFKIG